MSSCKLSLQESKTGGEDMQGSRDGLGVETAFCTGPKNTGKAVWEVAFC